MVLVGSLISKEKPSSVSFLKQQSTNISLDMVVTVITSNFSLIHHIRLNPVPFFYFQYCIICHKFCYFFIEKHYKVVIVLYKLVLIFLMVHVPH